NWLENSGICCYIENSYFPKKETDRSGSGIGLENLKKRLDLLYPGKYDLRTEREGNKFVAQLKIGS
ncbi:UNVERIFIED_CONTAM: sensor histidine kinase, partial [Bacteroidetes bacterium 56_B9]